MIKEIPIPNIKFKFSIFSSDKFFIKNGLSYIYNSLYDETIYFNKNGYRHRDNGPAIDDGEIDGIKIIKFCLNGFHYEEPEFAEKTNHLICLNCYKFCKQECFI